MSCSTKDRIFNHIMPCVLLSLAPLLFVWMFIEWGILAWDWPFILAWLGGTAAAAVLLTETAK
jgi:hypothetical protein